MKIRKRARRNRNSDFVQCYEKKREDDNEAIPSNQQLDRESQSNSNGSTVKPDRNSARARKIDMECQTGNDFVESSLVIIPKKKD